MATLVRSYSKINLGLAIGPPRADGFHALTTLYQTLALADVVTISAKIAEKTEILCTSNNPKVPLDDSNTAVKMLKAWLLRANICADVSVHIEKTLPVQGGLGAGSANAAAALIGLEAELNQSLPAAERLELAAEIGSDVPLFLLGGSVLGLHRGEMVYPLPDLPQMACLVVVPPLGVSTPKAFADWDLLLENQKKKPQNISESQLTTASNSDRLNMLSRVLASAFAPSIASGVLQNSQDLAENPLLALVRTGIVNDFESVVYPVYPTLSALKRCLIGSKSDAGQAVYSALSGSGSALFGLYSSVPEAEAARQRVLEFSATELPGTEVLLTRTIQRDEYWKLMILK